MAGLNITETEALPGADVYASITTIETTSILVESYMYLLFDSLEYNLDDPAESRIAHGKIYALLVAMRTQVEALLPMPETLMRALREMRKV